MSENFYLNEHVLPRTTITCHALTRAGNFLHSRSRAMRWHTRLELWRHGWYHPPYPSLTCLSSRPGLTRTDLEIWPGPNRLKLFKKKKKSERKKCFDQVDLWLWQKSQNFQMGPVPLSFSHTFQFQNPFLCSRLGNCANCLNSRKLTFAQILTKSQNFQQGPVFPYFLRWFWFWSLFLHLRIWNCSNSVILQLLALMWTLTKNQDVWAKIVLFRFSHRFWLWNPLICFWLGNHLCDPLLQSTSSIQNLSSQDQNLRFIHLVWIPSRLFSRLYQGFPFKVQMISHKCVLNLKLHWITSSTYLLIRCLPVSNLPFPFDAYRSQPLVSPKILNWHSQLPIYHSSSLHYK